MSHRKWKYNDQIDQHYLETDETGELVQSYLQQTEHEEVESGAGVIVPEFQDLDMSTPLDIKAPRQSKGSAERPPAEQELQELHNLFTQPP